jgi:hypothetical protein
MKNVLLMLMMDIDAKVAVVMENIMKAKVEFVVQKVVMRLKLVEMKEMIIDVEVSVFMTKQKIKETNVNQVVQIIITTSVEYVF